MADTYYQAKELWIDSTDTGMYSKSLGFKLGIFDVIYTRINSVTPPTRTLAWLTTDAKWYFDVDYLYNYVGNRMVSPIANGILNDSNIPSSVRVGCAKTMVANIILNRFYTKWTKLYAVLSLQYNAIHNYDMTEVVTPNLTNTSLSKTTTDFTNTENQSSYGYNSSTDSPVSKNIVHTEGDGDENKVDTTTTQTGTTRTTRSGNIGGTTSQKMVSDEIALWQWEFIRDVVYPDITSVLLSDIY